MAGAATDGLDFEDNGILVAIYQDMLDFLDIAACHAFDPEFVSGARPVCAKTRADGLVPGQAVHIGLHEDEAGGVILYNDGQEPGGGF